MNSKNNLKLKTELEKPGKQEPVVDKQLIAKELEQEKLKMRAMWQSAITELSASKFSSLDSAIDRITDIVIEKLKLPNAIRNDYKNLISIAIESDPGLEQQLRKSININ